MFDKGNGGEIRHRGEGKQDKIRVQASGPTDKRGHTLKPNKAPKATDHQFNDMYTIITARKQRLVSIAPALHAVSQIKTL